MDWLGVVGVLESPRAMAAPATAALAGKAGKANRVSGPKAGISLRNEAPPPEVCGAVYRSKGGGGSYFQRLKQSEKGSRGDGAAEPGACNNSFYLSLFFYFVFYYCFVSHGFS